MKIDIEIIVLGKINSVNFDKIINFAKKSTVMNCEIVSTYETDNIKFDESIYKFLNDKKILNNNKTYLVIINQNLVNEEYISKIIFDNIYALNIFGIKEILKEDNIGIEAFIIKSLYLCVFLNKIHNLKDYDIFHYSTGCIFDRDRRIDKLKLSSNKPQICEKCDKELKKIIPVEFYSKIKKELPKIKKEPLYRIRDFISNHIIISLLISSIYAIFIGITSSILVWRFTSSLENNMVSVINEIDKDIIDKYIISENITDLNVTDVKVLNDKICVCIKPKSVNFFKDEYFYRYVILYGTKYWWEDYVSSENIQRVHIDDDSEAKILIVEMDSSLNEKIKAFKNTKEALENGFSTNELPEGGEVVYTKTISTKNNRDETWYWE